MCVLKILVLKITLYESNLTNLQNKFAELTQESRLLSRKIPNVAS